MKLKLKHRVTSEEAVEVEFPLYRKHDLLLDDCDSVIYTRIMASPGGREFIEHSIHVRKNSFHRFEPQLEYELSVYAMKEYGPDGASGLDYLLGLGQYASTREEFEKALSELKGAVQMVAEVNSHE